MPVEQVEKELFTSESRRVDAEFRRLDSEISGVKKSQEKFETKTEKAINDLRIDVGALRAEMNARFDKFGNSVDARFEKFENSVDARFNKFEESVAARFESVEARFDKFEESVDGRFDRVDARFGKLDEKMDRNFKFTVTIYLTTMGIVLAAFYAFASYMVK
ncbi:MAG: hypothetical protein LBO82_06265 [Synergistaceae bacterium]|jgi:hypothetical protein|nr:hypothetical protein [Synergistaceae bacterium]